MKNYKNLSFLVIAISFSFFGCDKYLDITPKGRRLLTTVSDYNQWLNDQSLIETVGQAFNTLNLLSDNVDMVNITTPPTSNYELVYTWATQFSTDIKVAPVFWGDHYAKINHFNTVIIGVDNATGGTNAQKRSLKAEAILGRAFEYFYLLKMYGKPYDLTTADKDLAVPYVTSNDVSQKIPARSTVAQIYDHIITDLKSVIADLPSDNSSNRFRGSISAGYSLLARTYFYARDYNQARKNAELALSLSKASMLNLNGEIPTSGLSLQRDVIYGRMFMGSNTVSLDYMNSFSANDLRVRTYFYSTDGYNFTVRGATQFSPLQVTPVFIYLNSGTSVQEMKLIIAECAARENDLTTALQQLDDIRKNRFDKDDYVRFQSVNKEEVLEEVLLERNHELGFSGLRWFDMRRLDKENRMPAVNRYDANGNVIATLMPKSDRYTLQIPMQVLSFNPGMPQNL